MGSSPPRCSRSGSDRTPSRACPTSTTTAAGSRSRDAHTEVIWPGYRTAIERIRDDLSDPERAAWFALTLEGDRSAPLNRPDR